MSLSVIIPFKNEFELIDSVINHIVATANSEDYEIIVVNDGSLNHFGKFVPLEIPNPKVRVINISKTFGVGASFDRGVENCTYENIVLMGADIYAKEGWYEKVRNEVSRNPNSIGCAVCVGDKPPYRKYYGADMLITMGNNDLPPKSKLRDRRGGYTSLFKGKWAEKKGNEPYDIACLMGAMYFTTKSWYNKIHGWDTLPNVRHRGHMYWGSLEPYISLKSWLYGGGCYLVPDIEATHLFNRVTRENKYSKGARSAEFMWWNALFILETMVLSEFTRNRIYDFVNPELNFNVARQMIKKNYDTVLQVRNRNRLKFVMDLNEYINKFNIKI